MLTALQAEGCVGATVRIKQLCPYGECSGEPAYEEAMSCGCQLLPASPDGPLPVAVGLAGAEADGLGAEDRAAVDWPVVNGPVSLLGLT